MSGSDYISRLSLEYAGRSCGKPTSEDFFDAARPDRADFESHGVVLALADGMSGGSGRRAAEICVRAVLSDYYAAPAGWDVAKRLERIISAVNSWLLAQNVQAAQVDCMLSTLSVLVLEGRQFHIAHVGDCRIYRVRDAAVECLTTDHVWPRSDMRRVLRRAIGLDQNIAVDCWSDDLKPQDRFVLLSDGVWEVLGDRSLGEALLGGTDARDLAQTLVAQSIDKQRVYYGRNDATAAVVQVLAVPIQGP